MIEAERVMYMLFKVLLEMLSYLRSDSRTITMMYKNEIDMHQVAKVKTIHRRYPARPPLAPLPMGKFKQ